MLEGTELEGKIGDYGSYKADITPGGIVEVSVGVTFDIIAELEKLAKKTDNSIDDKIVALVKAALGRV
jgi:hypothetical protein